MLLQIGQEERRSGEVLNNSNDEVQFCNRFSIAKNEEEGKKNMEIRESW